MNLFGVSPVSVPIFGISVTIERKTKQEDDDNEDVDWWDADSTFGRY